MASTLYSLLFLLSTLTLLHQPPLSAANLHSTAALFRSQPFSEPTSLPPPTFLPLLSLRSQNLSHSPKPNLAHYKPPTDCPSQNFARIVLEWTAACKGRQFDRIFGVWLGGVEILRSCTAEPRATGIVWTVKKDITRYYSLLMSNQTLAVYLGNLVDSTYTGVYHVNVSIHFYPADKSYGYSAVEYGELDNGYGFGSVADLILPISRNLPLNDGLWFEIENSTDVESKEFLIPQNVYRAVLEVLDGLVVGAVWPFTVIYTGGVNPLLWRPITAIGSFDLPSYDIEITPLLSKILDGKSHKLAFSVTNALNVWYIDANLHLWLDKGSDRTQGNLLEYSDSPLSLSLLSNFTGLDGLFITNVSRSISYSGWVKSSHGVVTTKSLQEFKFSNAMVMGNDGNQQILDQVTFQRTVDAKTPSSSILSTNSLKKFTLDFYSDSIDKGNGTYDSVANVTLGIDATRQKTSKFGTSTSRLKNLQNGQGNMLVKGNLVVSGLGSTQQEYHYISDKSCYFRNALFAYNCDLLCRFEWTEHSTACPAYQAVVAENYFDASIVASRAVLGFAVYSRCRFLKSRS
ncbi:UNVERIFIED_CONTAM: Peptide-N4-(N-acetyl-beta-glucosaminyl)asparagine amidase A [Sesamum calycinum]|uniref:Peptide-N4-(N-acetyl-beta-glucosaminyl)asparagine amidase A n=1 Tax=Sesamum calycinum TaxID=2727403 RepID=A0AAW2Q497_9LAMI